MKEAPVLTYVLNVLGSAPWSSTSSSIRKCNFDKIFNKMATSVAAGDEMTIPFQWLHATLLTKRVFAPCGVIRELIYRLNKTMDVKMSTLTGSRGYWNINLSSRFYWTRDWRWVILLLISSSRGSYGIRTYPKEALMLILVHMQHNSIHCPMRCVVIIRSCKHLEEAGWDFIFVNFHASRTPDCEAHGNLFSLVAF